MEISVRLMKLADLAAAERAKLLRRAEVDIGQAFSTVQPLIAAIRAEGNAALLRYVQQHDNPQMTLDTIEVTRAEIETAKKRLDPKITAAIKHAFNNIRKVHADQMREPITMTMVEPGVMAGEKITPIPRIGLYVPRGKGAFPSVMLMLATPAMVAGVPEIIVCTPPTAAGLVDDASLVAADMCGVHRIFKIGGAQAIAAMALGTTLVPKVDKLMGPCNAYGSAAKRLLTSEVNVGMLAGPSESIVLADSTADPELVAYDLLVEAEHGPESAAILVTHDEALAKKVQSLLPDIIAKLPEQRKNFCLTGLNSYGGILVTESLEDSIAFVNDYAPEHLLLQMADPWTIVGAIKNAGEILMGEATPIPLGNFAIGVNAVLPTGGFARSSSCTSIRDFQKSTSLAYVTREGFRRLQGSVMTLADEEGFPAHANAVRRRVALWG
jgi:histidinol dehydrogenase